METMEVNGDAPPPQTQPQLESGTASFDEGFENFFNNQTLSDRVLYICETEKVLKNFPLCLQSINIVLCFRLIHSILSTRF